MNTLLIIAISIVAIILLVGIGVGFIYFAILVPQGVTVATLFNDIKKSFRLLIATNDALDDIADAIDNDLGRTMAEQVIQEESEKIEKAKMLTDAQRDKLCSALEISDCNEENVISACTDLGQDLLGCLSQYGDGSPVPVAPVEMVFIIDRKPADLRALKFSLEESLKKHFALDAKSKLIVNTIESLPENSSVSKVSFTIYPSGAAVGTGLQALAQPGSISILGVSIDIITPSTGYVACKNGDIVANAEGCETLACVVSDELVPSKTLYGEACKTQYLGYNTHNATGGDPKEYLGKPSILTMKEAARRCDLTVACQGFEFSSDGTTQFLMGKTKVPAQGKTSLMKK